MATEETGGMPKPLVNYTTAQQLGAFRRELMAEGFTPDQAAEIVVYAFRSEVGFVVRFADIEGEPLGEQPVEGESDDA